MEIPVSYIQRVTKKNSIQTMDEILSSKFAPKESDYKPGKVVVAYNSMDKGKYSYTLTAKYGDVREKGYFEPEYTPKQMLEYGVFEGKYLNDCVLEFPKEWFQTALKKGKLSPSGADITCNCFEIKSRQNLSIWEENGWVPESADGKHVDNRGWFQWYCRYYLGRRVPDLDAEQIARWKAFRRHYAQVSINCGGDTTCRPRQRQGLLQWSWPAFD
jgi:hypothetical protein